MNSSIINIPDNNDNFDFNIFIIYLSIFIFCFVLIYSILYLCLNKKLMYSNYNIDLI